MHTLLKRQLKKSGIDKANVPTTLKWQDFIARVERAYLEADKERYLIERSLKISSQEMQEVYEQLRESETRYALSAQGANDGLWDWNLVTEEFYCSQRTFEILGGVEEPDLSVCKKFWQARVHSDDRKKVIAELDAHLKGDTKHFKVEHRLTEEYGQNRWVLVRGMAVRDKNEKAIRIAGSMTDISEQKRTEEKLAHDAVHDDLTGLPNRKKLMERIDILLTDSDANLAEQFGVLFVDIDRFKLINDSMGHMAGDELLLQITNKLRKLIRPKDMVARIGGDEFVVLLENVNDKDEVVQVAQRLLNELLSPINIDGEQIYASVSIGIAISSPDYVASDNVIRDADLAMYRAKLNGKSRFEIFDPNMHSGAVSQLHIERDLRRGCEEEEFVLHYQPIVLLDSESIIGFEALVRWNHPTRGFVRPDEFIPVAEETGVIVQMGQWILFEACRQMKAWQNEFPASEKLMVSVNLSTRQLEKVDLADDIAGVLKETGLDPKCLRLEITESVIMSNADQAVITVNQLRNMGVRVSIDDFGTGYSSLSYLHRFPVDTLKVDRSFINRIGNDGGNAEIVQTIITLAYSLNMDVVAEGVETSEQLEFLREANCSYGQGYYYSKPLDRIEAGKLVEELESETPKMNPISVPKLDQTNNFIN